MTTHLPLETIHEKARRVDVAELLARPSPLRNRGTRVFDLHPAVHAAVIGAYLALAGILCLTFMNAEMAIPAAIVIIGVVGLFLVPGLWARVVPEDGLAKPSWAEFMGEGVDCCTGRLTGSQALAQILILPALLVGFALFIAVLKATL